jgi:hypothetical protein
VHGLWLLPISWAPWRARFEELGYATLAPSWHASYKRQVRNPNPTEIIEMPGRGHSLVVDSGWREVADTATAFLARHAAGPA